MTATSNPLTRSRSVLSAKKTMTVADVATGDQHAAAIGRRTARNRSAESATTNRLQAQTLIDTPLGKLRMAATENGLAGLWFEGQQHHPGELKVPDEPTHAVLASAASQLAAYFRGQLHHFDLPLDAAGTEFHRAVWQALMSIPPGETSTYGAIASRAGRPAAVRAVGAAIGRNPISIIVPCHRVIGGDGSLTGYAGGLPRKQALLELEGALAPGSTKATG